MSKLLKNVILTVITGIRPFFGPAECKFEPSCMKYAEKQLETRPLWPALKAITWQLIRCSPLQGLLERKKDRI